MDKAMFEKYTNYYMDKHKISNEYEVLKIEAFSELDRKYSKAELKEFAIFSYKLSKVKGKVTIIVETILYLLLIILACCVPMILGVSVGFDDLIIMLILICPTVYVFIDSTLDSVRIYKELSKFMDVEKWLMKGRR